MAKLKKSNLQNYHGIESEENQFFGSGSTGIAALQNDRNAVLIDNKERIYRCYQR